MKKVFSVLMLLVLVLTPLLSYAAMAQEISPRSAYVRAKDVDLSFSGGSAVCSGYVTPNGNYPVSVLVTLYKQTSSGWSYVASWSGSSTGGSKAQAGGSVAVGSGTYKVTLAGNVNNGSEYPSANIVKTK